MVDSKISDLTALTSPADEDLLVTVDDPSGTPVTKKITKLIFLKQRTLDPSPDSDHTGSGETITGTAGETLAAGELVYLKSDGKFWKADADAESTTKGVLGVIMEALIADGTGSILINGFVRDDTWSWTVGSTLYVSTTGGDFTETAPSGSSDCVRIAGQAYSATVIWFKPSQTYFTL